MRLESLPTIDLDELDKSRAEIQESLDEMRNSQNRLGIGFLALGSGMFVFIAFGVSLGSTIGAIALPLLVGSCFAAIGINEILKNSSCPTKHLVFSVGLGLLGSATITIIALAVLAPLV